MENINKLITQLMAISHYAKDIHYNCPGDSFYSNHLFADRIFENIGEYIDSLKEVCLLGHKIKPLASAEYLKQAASLIPSETDFKKMRKLLYETLVIIEETKNISKGDDNLLGTIAQDIQNSLGLINIKYGDF